MKLDILVLALVEQQQQHLCKWNKTGFLAVLNFSPSSFLGWLANNSSHVSQVPMVAFQIARAHFQLYLLFGKL